jgi:hypothetical protein
MIEWKNDARRTATKYLKNAFLKGVRLRSSRARFHRVRVVHVTVTDFNETFSS